MNEKTKKKLIKYAKIIGFAIITIYLLDTLGLKYWWAYLLFVLLIALWRSWNYRDSIMQIIRITEITIWGKPLEKHYWEKGELRKKKNKKGEKKI